MYQHSLHKRLSSTGVILNMINGFQNAEIYCIIVRLQIFRVFLMLYNWTLSKPKKVTVIHSVYSPYLKNSLQL
jgi:hypothetical protein